MRVAVKTSAGHYRLLDISDIFYLEGEGDDVLVRTAGGRPYRSVHRLDEWERRSRALGFLRIHRSYIVNLAKVREVRVRSNDPNDWEVKLDRPVGAVLPVSRSHLAELRAALEL